MWLLALITMFGIGFFVFPNLNSYLTVLLGKDATPIIVVLNAAFSFGYISIIYWDTERKKAPDQRDDYWRFIGDVARENLLFWLWLWLIFAMLFTRPILYMGESFMEPVLQKEDWLTYAPFSYIGIVPQRGDVIYYARPNSSNKFVGRIVGLPGEEIAIRNGALFVNGILMNESYLNYEGVSSTLAQDIDVDIKNYAVISDDRDGSLTTIEPQEILGKVYFRYWPLGRIGFLPEASYTDLRNLNGEQKIAFVLAQNKVLKIAIANVNRVGLILPIDFNCNVWHPTWSPDGKQIAFFADCEGNDDIYVMPIGGKVIRLTTDQSIDRYPAWSPDGTQIAFSSNRDGDWEIYTVNPNSDKLVKLTDNFTDEYWPTWSPDSKNIAFVSNRDGNFEIYKMEANGTQQVRLTDNPSDDSLPDWSPDGTRIAFNSDRTEEREIYVMNVSGTNVTQITNTKGKNFAPDWSADSSKIVFVSTRDGKEKIYVMKADGTDVRKLPYSTGDEGRPVWQPFVIAESPAKTSQSNASDVIEKKDTSQEVPQWFIGSCLALWGFGIVGWYILARRVRSRSNHS